VRSCLQSDKILENVKARSVQLMKGLNDLKKQFPHAIKDVRACALASSALLCVRHPVMRVMSCRFVVLA
jgi:hypothetical protein